MKRPGRPAFRVAIAAFAGGAIILGCVERPEPAPGGPDVGETPAGPKHEEAGAPERHEPERPKLESVRDLGVTREKVGDPAKGLSEHALAFYKELGEIARAGKVEHPTGLAERRADGRALMLATGGAKLGAVRGGGAPSPAASAAPARMRRAGARPKSKAYFGGSAGGAGAALAEKLGVTTGGMQDIGQARKIIGSGRVPSPGMFAAEGLLSEHDIPLEGMPSGVAELYASASVSWTRRFGEKEPVAVVQLGFGVDMERLAFHRPPLNLAVVVDVSGSMRGGKMEAVRTALAKLLDQLNEEDRFAVVLFNNTGWVPLPSQVLDDEGLKKAKDICSKIQAGGGTSIEAGLRLGYEQIAAHLEETVRDQGGGDEPRSGRVMLLTDAQPNVGATTAHGFKPMMEGAAAKGIGLTAFGVGLDFGQALAYEVFQTRGANYFYLEDEAKIAKCFDEEFEYMVTPAAYDVLVMMVPAEGAEVIDALGVPDHKKDAEGVELKIPSLFFSKREGGGASLVAMKLAGRDFSKMMDVAKIDLSFLPVGADERVRQKIEVYLPNGLDPEAKAAYYSQEGAKKALLLANAVVAMKAACRGQRAPRPEEAGWTIGEKAASPPGRGVRGDLEITLSEEQAKRAAEGLGAFADWFAGEAGGFPALEKELRLVEKLESTLRATGGLPPRASARVIPATEGPDTSPPELDVF